MKKRLLIGATLLGATMLLGGCVAYPYGGDGITAAATAVITAAVITLRRRCMWRQAWTSALAIRVAGAAA